MPLKNKEFKILGQRILVQNLPYEEEEHYGDKYALYDMLLVEHYVRESKGKIISVVDFNKVKEKYGHLSSTDIMEQVKEAREKGWDLD